MVVVALGHGIKATDDPISYPNGFLAIATTEKVTVGVNAAPDAPASRAIVAKIAYNTIMDATYLRIEASDDNKKPTIAKDVLGLLTVESILLGVDEDGITLSTSGLSSEDAAKAAAVNGATFKGANPDYVGMNVSAMYKKDSVSGKVTVYGVISASNKILEVAAKDFVNADSFAKYKETALKSPFPLTRTTFLTSTA
jgi:hypothetical protein